MPLRFIGVLMLNLRSNSTSMCDQFEGGIVYFSFLL